MSVGDSLRRLIDASASAAPEAPALLLEHIGAQVDPLSILAGYDPFHRAGELLEEDFPGLRHLAARRTTRSDGQITGLLRWLVDGLKDWKRGNDPGHVQLVSLLSVVLLLGNCRKVWDAIPDDVGANSELIAALEAAVLSSHVTISPRQNAPIWEGEAITVLTRADSEQDWPEIADRWRSFESAIIGEPFLLVAACGLARFRFDRLVTAVHSHAQTVDCMRLAGALMVGERLSLALATANEHVRFCCVYSAMRDCPRQSSLRPEEQEALTNVLVVVSNDLPNWKKWMQVFARYSVRYGALQAPLGTALARVQDGALKYYVDAIELNIGGAVGRDAVAACFTAFRDESNVGRRTRLWQLAYERWLEWNFGASSADSLVSGISRSELDFAVVGHIVETTSQTDRSRTIKELTRDLAAIETAWHVSHTDMITAWYRILSKIQPFAHADYVVSSGGNWLSTTTVQLPYSPDDPYPRLKYGHFDRRQ